MTIASMFTDAELADMKTIAKTITHRVSVADLLALRYLSLPARPRNTRADAGRKPDIRTGSIPKARPMGR
jgi:hypothetical protein